MNLNRPRLSVVTAFFFTSLLSAQASGAFAPPGWTIQDSDLVADEPASISTAVYDDSEWVPARVPNTVLGALVESGRYGDPFYGKNFPKEKRGEFSREWWYRTTFTLPSSFSGRRVDLELDGLNYRATVWVNGSRVEPAEPIVGMYRKHVLDLSAYLLAGAPNAIAISVSPPAPGDLTAAWVDWNPAPADHNMGLYREVRLVAHGEVALRDPQVVTHLEADSSARLRFEVDAENESDQAVTGELRAESEGVTLSQIGTLAPHERKTFRFDAETYAELRVANPKLWWPRQMGEPNLHSLRFTWEKSDSIETRYGIREITSELTPEGSRLYRVNGKPILIRGGGWASDLFLRESPARIAKEFDFVEDLNLNTVRLEGRFDSKVVLDEADRRGILIMPGFVCCNAWQEPQKWPEGHRAVALASLRDRIRELRAHASAFVFLYGSDEAPPADLEQDYLDVLTRERWPHPSLASAAESETPRGGKTGVKMRGPYDYTPPSYWLTDTRFGGAFGFNTETSPGAAVPPLETLEKFIPKKHLWPIGSYWNFHAGLDHFKDIAPFEAALKRRYGPAHSAEEFTTQAQLMAYDNHRAMFEAFGKRKYHPATGIVQWMLNNAWPSLIWHLYDYELRTGGSYFGAKKANEPVHIQYSYDDRSVVVVNSTYAPTANLVARATVLDMNLARLAEMSAPVRVDADSVATAFTLPETLSSSKTYFVKLELRDVETDRAVSHNFYWLSTVPEVYDWDKTDFAATPVLSEADLTELRTLPPVRVKLETKKLSRVKSRLTSSVEVTNPTPTLALGIRLRYLDLLGHEIVPALWTDNYISLLPGESRTVEVTLPDDGGLDRATHVEADGWNVSSR